MLIGQCSNTLTYDRHKNVLLGVTGTSTTHVAAMLKEKVSFLQKHNKALCGKEFTDNLAETINAKNQSIKTITETIRPNSRHFFRGGPSQNKMGGRLRQYHNNGDKQGKGKCFSLRGVVPFHNVSLPSPTPLSMEVLTHASPLLKRLFSKMTVPISPLAGRLKHFLPALRLLTKDQCVLSRKVQDLSTTRTKANVFPKTSTMEKRSERTDKLGSEKDVGEGSYLQSFTAERRISQSNISSREKGWGQQVSKQSEKPQQICTMYKISLKYVYFSVPLSKESQKLVRF